MSAMDIFNVVVGVCTIISLILSIFATSKVLSIQASLKVSSQEQRTNTTGNQTIKGSGNKQAGGSIG